MVPGALRQRVIIQSRTNTQDATGAPAAAWATRATVWAAIEPLSGRELIAAKQAQSETNTRIRCRYVSGAATTDRVVWGSRIFAVNAVIDVDERHRETQLLCTEAL